MRRNRAMTEDAWLSAETYAPLLEYLEQSKVGKSPAGKRKLRLLFCACMRRFERCSFWDEAVRTLVKYGEERSEGGAPEMDYAGLVRARRMLQKKLPAAAPAPETMSFFSRFGPSDVLFMAGQAALKVAFPFEEKDKRGVLEHIDNLGLMVLTLEMKPAGKTDITLELGLLLERKLAEQSRGQAEIIRCIFGNPFRPPMQVEWRTPTTVALATAIYEERRFGDMPILGDALEEAACTDAVILDHCRGPGTHARGCWLVDLLLGKT